MRQCCEAVSDWTGLDVGPALGADVPTERLARRGVGQIRQSAVVAGMYDVLAEHGVRPDVSGGLACTSLFRARLGCRHAWFDEAQPG
jgi:hypothetical protein